MLLSANTVSAQNLADLYEIALQTDTRYQASNSSRLSIKESESIVAARLLPQIGISADYNDVDVKSASDDHYQRESYTLSINQPIYRRDRWLSLDQSKVQSNKADVDLLAAEQDLIIRLSTAYFDTLAAQDALDFVMADKKAISRQLDQAQQRFEVGLIAITDVHEAQAAFDQATANEIDAENKLDSAKEILREIVGDQLSELDRLAPEIELTPPMPEGLAVWTEEALQKNPLILSAMDSAQVAKQEIELQKSGHYPTLDLVGSHALSRSEASNGTDTDTTTVGLQLEIPLYAGGGVVSATKKAQHDLDVAQQAVDQQQRAITRQVRDAYRGVLSSISRVKALEATRVSSKSALEATEAGFEVGTRTIVDVLNSQRNLYSTMNDYAQARYGYIVNGMLLKQAAGTLSIEDLNAVNKLLGSN